LVSLSFIVTSILILFTPGPTNTVLASCGAAMGFRRAAILTFAGAMGYVIAVSFFVLVSARIGASATAIASVRIAAAAWLSYSAYRLWKTPSDNGTSGAGGGFARVLLTTIVNPKAMLVGTVLIPAGADGGAGLWIGTFAALAALIGLVWILVGALLPLGVRRHAYKLAAVVLSGFSLATVASALG
jgi:threonine/homoserine/homoserine lactone efflux protein